MHQRGGYGPERRLHPDSGRSSRIMQKIARRRRQLDLGVPEFIGVRVLHALFQTICTSPAVASVDSGASLELFSAQKPAETRIRTFFRPCGTSSAVALVAPRASYGTFISPDALRRLVPLLFRAGPHITILASDDSGAFYRPDSPPEATRKGGAAAF